MKSIWFAVALILFSGIINGCESNGKQKEESSARSPEQEKRKVTEKGGHGGGEQNISVLKKAGFEFSKDKIVIDTKRTKEFLERVGSKFQIALDNMVKKGDGNNSLKKEEIINVSDDKLEIDLKKTKEFMKNWADAIESFSREVEDIMEESLEQ